MNIMISAIFLQTSSGGNSGFGMIIILSIIGIMVYIFSTRSSKNNNNTQEKKNIPPICPHCKNPNSKNLQECEWCGNKIY